MARPSPLTTIAIGLTAAVIAAAIFVVVRSATSGGERAEGPHAAASEVELPPPRPSPSPELRGAGEAPLPPRAEAEAPPSLAAEPPSLGGAGGASETGAPGETEAGAGAADAAATRRAALADWHGRWRQEADERVLEAMKLPDGTRAAIRKINDDFATRARASARETAAPDGARPSRGGMTFSADAEAESARRSALGLVLGGDAYPAFEAAERVELQRLRGKYRFDRARLFAR